MKVDLDSCGVLAFDHRLPLALENDFTLTWKTQQILTPRAGPLAVRPPCSWLREWTFYQEVNVVKGADGFVALHDSTTKLTASTFSVAGELVETIGTLPWTDCHCSTGIMQASAAAGVTALVGTAGYKFHMGDVLVASSIPTISLGGLDDAYAQKRYAVSVRADGRFVLSQSQPLPDSSRMLTVSLLDSAGLELQRADLSTADLDLVEQVSVSNDHVALILGNPTAALERPIVSSLWLLDAKFNKLAEWRAPPGTAILGMDTAQDGSLVLVGSTKTSSTSPQRTWIHALTLPALTDAWKSSQLGIEGRFEDVDATLDSLVALGASTDGHRVWIDILAPDGVSVSAAKPSATLRRTAYYTGVQVQSDGSILLSTGDDSFVCE